MELRFWEFIKFEELPKEEEEEEENDIYFLLVLKFGEMHLVRKKITYKIASTCL